MMLIEDENHVSAWVRASVTGTAIALQGDEKIGRVTERQVKHNDKESRTAGRMEELGHICGVFCASIFSFFGVSTLHRATVQDFQNFPTQLLQGSTA